LFVFLDFTENFGGSCQRAGNDFDGSKDELYQSVANFAWIWIDLFYYKVTRQQEGGV